VEAEIDIRYIFVRQFSLMDLSMGGRGELLKVLTFFEDGRLKPVVDSVFALSDAAKAQSRMEKKRTFWQDSSEDLELHLSEPNFCVGLSDEAYSGTESAISFPLTTLTNRYRLVPEDYRSSFSPSVTVKTSCPSYPIHILPIQIASVIFWRRFLS